MKLEGGKNERRVSIDLDGQTVQSANLKKLKASFLLTEEPKKKDEEKTSQFKEARRLTCVGEYSMAMEALKNIKIEDYSDSDEGSGSDNDDEKAKEENTKKNQEMGDNYNEEKSDSNSASDNEAEK